jgi:hypothetical protein
MLRVCVGAETSTDALASAVLVGDGGKCEPLATLEVPALQWPKLGWCGKKYFAMKAAVLFEAGEVSKVASQN